MTYKPPIKESNQIILRPRFQLELPYNNQHVLKAFENVSQQQDDFLVKRLDDHVFIKYPKANQTYWTPQLHLEINEEGTQRSKLYGLFGPNPTVWLLFMFFHFVIALIFLGFCIWGYANWSLDNSYIVQVSIAVMMIVVWVIFYLFGRLGRATAKPKMQELKVFMDTVLKTIDDNQYDSHES